MKTYTVKRVLTAHTCPVLSVCVLSDGRFASGDFSGNIQLWSRQAEPGVVLTRSKPDTEQSIFPKVKRPHNPIRSLVMPHAAELISAAENGDICRWDLNSESLKAVVEAPSAIAAVAALSFI
jgi:hypothetical protein